jgi:NADH dehydrogenase [ubiquinone] 1 alpha subcomplex assembly factor 1
MALIDRIPGAYDLSIGKIWATNATEDDDILANVEGVVSGLPSSREGPFRKPHPPSKESKEEYIS